MHIYAEGERLLVAIIMSVRRILSVSLTVFVLAALLLLLPLTQVNAQVAPNMGDATTFAVLGGSTITNSGNSLITGDLGLSPGTSITGFPPGIVVPPGTIHAADTQAANAQTATTAAYLNLAGQGPSTVVGPNLGGLTLVPGIYAVGAAASNLVGTLTLNGTATDVWIFQMSSSLITSTGSSVVIIGGGSACNVFWQVGSSASLGSGSTFLGNILALTSIGLGNAASVSGRLLARNGAVTLINNNVDDSVCAPLTPGGIGVSKIFSPSTIIQGGVSTLTITLSNTNNVSAILLSNFTDTLPAGLVIAPTPNVATTCGGSGAPTATPGGSTVTLPTNRSIPAGSISTPGICTLTVRVTSQLVGSYVNTLAVGALHTDKGDNVLETPPAGATLGVSEGPPQPPRPPPPPIPVGGQMLTINMFRVVLPWAVLLTVLGIVAVQTLIIRRRKTID